MHVYVENILKVWDFAQSGTFQDWYAVEGEWVKKVSKTFNTTSDVVAYVVATTSPFLAWAANKETAVGLLEFEMFGYTNKKISAFGANTKKVFEAFDGLRPFIATGCKVRSFQLNLLGDRNSVTVDRHAVSIALYGINAIGRPSGAKTLTKTSYEIFATAYRQAAEILCVDPCLVQSVTWQMVAKA